MLGRRPFGSQEALMTAARDEWFALSEEDWREAFSHHPRIGDVADLRRRFPATHALSAREQRGVTGVSGEVLSALAEANRAYLERFGYIFIICASGRSAEEMLDALQRRLRNDPAVEILIAAEEQARIMELRLSALT
jgi:2-oxo-4-hydroxy-4-carboxy-5-ureidoimidazoline decarboxylase